MRRRRALLAIALGVLVAGPGWTAAASAADRTAPVNMTMAGLTAYPPSTRMPQSLIVQVAGAGQCKAACMERYRSCETRVRADFDAKRIDDLEPGFEDCSNQLKACNRACN